jgi:hypothetical protein
MNREFRHAENLDNALRALPEKTPPSQLRTSLLVVASRERQRRIARRSVSSIFGFWFGRMELMCEHLVRTTALPAAGGFCSTMALFAMLVIPFYTLKVNTLAAVDVPTMLNTPVSIKAMSPFGAGDSDVVVDVAVDGQGRMIDYAVISGATALATSEIRRRLENALLFTEFTPATTFGQPTASKVRLWFHASRIDVRG